jgi:glycosyltransferase involved in cell wall biosynthesis
VTHCMLDLCMWTLNGERTLPSVLERINQVIPREVINQKFIVDDGSIDNTVGVAKAFGWRVIVNEGKGISAAANTALDNVSSRLFCSFEQDVILAPDWFKRVPNLVEVEPLVCGGLDCAVASGARVSFGRRGLYGLGMYEVNRYKNDPIGVGGYNFAGHRFGMSLDNTCYNADIIREVGGFPKVVGGPGVDVLLANKIFGAGYRWSVDYSVVSNHVRRGLRDEFKHYYWYGRCQQEIDASRICYLGLVGRALFSPMRGIEIAFKQRDAACMLVYPAIRVVSLAGAVRGLL